MSGPGNYYQLLEVTPTATPKQIKAAYHRAAKAVHPDAGGSAAAMELVNEAYRVLSDPGLRREYDHGLNEPAPSRVQPEEAADVREHHHPYRQNRLAYARNSAWQLLKNSLVLAVMLGIIVRFFATQVSSQSAKLWLGVIGFVPVYGVLLGVVFLLNPDIRLALHDLPHKRGRQLKNDLILAASLAGAFIPLAALWLIFFRV